MWEELRISGGTAIIVLVALYFVIKWAVRKGVREAYRKIMEEDVREYKTFVKALQDDDENVEEAEE